MNKKLIVTIILLLLIGGAVFLIVRKPQESTDDIDSTDEIVSEETELIDENEEMDEEYEGTGSTDFSAFSEREQILGEKSEVQFSITGLEEKGMDGYHEVTFTMQGGEDDTEPFVTAKYMSSTGVIRMDFQGIEKDSSGLGYQQEKSLNTEGVLRIYHNVSAQQDQELYDIGVTKSTPFHLSSNSLGDGEWEITLKVKYPGLSTTDMDMGSEEFSREGQNIEGIGSSQNATISSYTYGRPAGLLKFVWVVTGTGENPIPTVDAEINSEGVLVVTFPSLTVDRVVSSEEMVLPSGIGLEAQRSGSASIYRFVNVPGNAEYRLSATLSPNQVVLEIQ